MTTMLKIITQYNQNNSQLFHRGERNVAGPKIDWAMHNDFKKHKKRTAQKYNIYKCLTPK